MSKCIILISIVITLFFVDITGGDQDYYEIISLNTVPKMNILRLDRHSVDYKNYHLKQLYTAILGKGVSLDRYLNTNPLHCNTRIEIPIPPTLRAREEDQLSCEKNCTNIIARQCKDCIEDTVEALAFSCKRMCGLTEGEPRYLHEFDIESQERRCKKVISRCCVHNCLRKLGKACYPKKQLCTRETMEILKQSCVSKCNTHSSNPYLNVFCSFVHVPMVSKQERLPFPFFNE